jgi:hypothetical protein
LYSRDKAAQSAAKEVQQGGITRMSESGWKKVGAATGLGFVGLVALSFILGATNPPDFNDGAGATASYVANHGNDIDTAAALLAGALVLFAFFLGSIASNSRKADRVGTLTATAHAGGITALALALVGVVLTAASSAASAQGADDTVVAALFNTSALAFLGASLGTAVLIYATGRIAMRFGALPSAIGIPSMLLGIATAAVAIIGLTIRHGAFSPYGFQVIPLVLLGLFGAWAVAVALSLWARA